MAITPYIQDIAVLTAAPTLQGQAVPVLTKRVIKAATLINHTGLPVAASVYLVPAGAVAGPTNVVIASRTIAPGESYPCPELIGQGLNIGGFVAASGDTLLFKYTATDFV